MSFATFNLASDPPTPIAATLIVATGAWTCTFDKALQTATLDASNWTFRASGDSWGADTASSSGSVVSGGATQGFPNAGDDVVNFAPPPFDVLDPQDRPAAAFSDFPLVVT